MPIHSKIAHAASAFRQNEHLLAKSYDGLTQDEWRRRPGETSNNMLWIAGHLVWARSRAVASLGSSWDRPWLSLFSRGAKQSATEQYPAPDEVLEAWREVSQSMTTAMEDATEELLEKPSSPPSTDEKISGLIGFLSLHETYHVGQAAYLRCWLGRGGIVG
jgi:uncharacterized damage-inducible protein DinB